LWSDARPRNLCRRGASTPPWSDNAAEKRESGPESLVPGTLRRSASVVLVLGLRLAPEAWEYLAVVPRTSQMISAGPSLERYRRQDWRSITFRVVRALFVQFGLGSLRVRMSALLSSQAFRHSCLA